jgi:hypothetical protein
VDIFQATVEKEPIRAMEISRRRRMLYVTSDTGIRQIDLAMCSARYILPYLLQYVSMSVPQHSQRGSGSSINRSAYKELYLWPLHYYVTVPLASALR